MSNVPYITLNNGMKMPQLGLGVYQVPNEQAEENVTVALQNGYRLLDTATIYGNEEGVGNAIRKSGIARSEIFLTTKLWNTNHGYDDAMRGFEASIKSLGVDYIDLYLIHWPVPMADLYVETWQALESLYKEGRVKAIGLSNFNQNHIDKVLENASVIPAVLQIEIHPTFNQPQLREYAKSKNIQVESWFPLGGQSGKDALLGLPLITELAAKYSKSPAQIVLRWHTQLDLVVIPKSSNPDRIKENISIFDFEMTLEEIDQISALDNGIRLGADPETADWR